MEKKEVAVLEKKVMPLIEAASTYTISTQNDMTHATILLSELGTYYDNVVSAREKVTKPLNAALAAARDMFNPIEKPAKAAIDALRGRISDYQTAETRRVQEEEAKLAERVKEGRGNLTLETAVRKATEIDKPETLINTESGSLKFRTGQKLKITDEKLIPRKFLLIDEKSLFEALKEGQMIPGAEIEKIQIPINSR